MNTALIFDECDRDQNEYRDEHDALFIPREFENPEQRFHSVWHSFGTRYVARLTTSLTDPLCDAGSQLIRDPSLRSNDEPVAFIVSRSESDLLFPLRESL
jgi:hypothetical protein